MARIKMALTKEQILAAQDCKVERVTVAAWGGDVFVKVLSGAGRDQFRAGIDEANKAGIGRFEAALLAVTVCNESGVPLFTVEDIDSLYEKSASAIDEVAAVAMRINGMGISSQDDAVKN